MQVREDASLPAAHITVHLDGVVDHAQVGVNPEEAVLELRMTLRQVHARPRRIVTSPQWFLDLLELDAHVVHVGIDSDQIDILVFFRPSL